MGARWSTVVALVIVTGLAGCTAPAPDPITTSPPAVASPGASYRGTSQEQLMAAVQAGDVPGAADLLAAGQSPNYWLADATPLGRAIVANDLAMAELLMGAGATVEDEEWSHTLVAAQYGDAAMMEFILSNGGFARGTGDLTGWPLATAAYAGNTDAIAVLIASGADPKALVSDERGEYPTLVYAVNGGSLEAVRALVEGGADPYAQGSDGTSAVTAAKAFGREQIADYLGTVVPSE